MQIHKCQFLSHLCGESLNVSPTLVIWLVYKVSHISGSRWVIVAHHMTIQTCRYLNSYISVRISQFLTQAWPDFGLSRSPNVGGWNSWFHFFWQISPDFSKIFCLPMNSRDVVPKDVPGLGWGGYVIQEWVGHGELGWAMQGWDVENIN